MEAKTWQDTITPALREVVATEAGLSFQRELIKQSKIPLTGATFRLAEDIEGIDPKAWEAICYAVADTIYAIYQPLIEQARKEGQDSVNTIEHNSAIADLINEGHKTGIRKVVEFLQSKRYHFPFYRYFETNEWQSQKKEWGINK